MTMKTVKKLYREILLPTCLIFTLLCFTFSLLLNAAGTEMSIPIINLENLTQIFVFSLILSASWQLFKTEKLPFALALILHFLCFLANVSVVFFLIGGHFISMQNTFTVLLILSLLYVIVATVAVTVRHFVLAQKREKKPYKRQF